MLLPEDRFGIFKRYFGISPATLMLGKRTEGVDGNAGLFRSFDNHMHDLRHGASERNSGMRPETMKRIFEHTISNGYFGNRNMPVPPHTVRQANRWLEVIANRDEEGLRELNAPIDNETNPWFRPGRANESLRSAIEAGNSDAAISALESLDFADIGIIRVVIDELKGCDDPDAVRSVVQPLQGIGLLWLFAMIEVHRTNGKGVGWRKLMPHRRNGGVVRPMRLWLERLQYHLQLDSQAALSRIVGAQRSDPVQDMKPYWAGIRPGWEKFGSILSAAKDYVRCKHRGASSKEKRQWREKISVLRLAVLAIPIVHCCDALLDEHDDEPDPLFGAYPELFECAVRVQGATP